MLISIMFIPSKDQCISLKSAIFCITVSVTYRPLFSQAFALQLVQQSLPHSSFFLKFLRTRTDDLVTEVKCSKKAQLLFAAF